MRWTKFNFQSAQSRNSYDRGNLWNFFLNFCYSLWTYLQSLYFNFALNLELHWTGPVHSQNNKFRHLLEVNWWYDKRDLRANQKISITPTLFKIFLILIYVYFIRDGIVESIQRFMIYFIRLFLNIVWLYIYF